MESIVWLDEAAVRAVEPSAGWNASATAQDRVRWSTLYTWLLRKGVGPEEASRVASQHMFQGQMPDVRYGRFTIEQAIRKAKA